MALIISFSFPLKNAKRKKGIDVKEAVDERGSRI